MSVEDWQVAIGPAEEPPVGEVVEASTVAQLEGPSAELEQQPQNEPQDPPRDPSQRQPPGADPWAPLLDAGLSLIAELARRSGDPAAAPVPWIERDAATGRDCLKLPLPEPATLQRVAQALGALAAALRP